MSKEPDRFVRRAILTIVLGISTGLVLGCDSRPDRVETSCVQEPMAAWTLACIDGGAR